MADIYRLPSNGYLRELLIQSSILKKAIKRVDLIPSDIQAISKVLNKCRGKSIDYLKLDETTIGLL